MSTGAIEVCPLDDGCRGGETVAAARGDSTSRFVAGDLAGGAPAPEAPDCQCCCAQIVNARYVTLADAADRAKTLVAPAVIGSDLVGAGAFHPPRARI